MLDANRPTQYADVQRILDEAVGDAELPSHGAFWRELTRDQFVLHEVFRCPIISSEGGRFIGPQSPLVRILRDAIECPSPRRRPRMPRGLPPVTEDNIQIISDWIDEQCPA